MATISRKAFLTSIIALFTAPFVKAKEPEPKTNEEIARYFKVPPAPLHNYGRATFHTLPDNTALIERARAYQEAYLRGMTQPNNILS